MSGFDKSRIARLDEVMAAHVANGEAGGLAWLAARDGQVVTGAAGTLTRGEGQPVERDSVFRIASVTKPVAAVAAMVLVEECRLRLDDPITDLLPELPDQRVLVDPRGPFDGETVPAARPITVFDVLTFTLGIGMDFEAPWPWPLLDALAALELGAGPPQPSVPPDPDEWMRRFSTLPLQHQPGERWLYNVGADLLGVLIARAGGRPLETFIRERVFDPLGMPDTGFVAAHPDRLGTCYSVGEGGERSVYDAPHGEWSSPPRFPSAAGGLVSTIDDLHAFGGMLLARGQLPDGSRLLSSAAVELMTTDHVGGSGPLPDGSLGWGFGMGVHVKRVGLGPTVGAYGWDGGLGSSWRNDPRERLVGVVLSTDAFTGPSPAPAPIRDFWTCVYSALD